MASSCTLALLIRGWPSAWAATARWCVVAMVAIPRSARSSRMARARAEPSSGSVLVPISSSSTSDEAVASPRMSITFLMCELNVETDCSMLCRSPTSAYMPSYTGSELPFSAETCRPDWCMAARSPTVFIATVLPPVFGPVMTRTDQSGPTVRSTGTASSPSRGWRADRSLRPSTSDLIGRIPRDPGAVPGPRQYQVEP